MVQEWNAFMVIMEAGDTGQRCKEWAGFDTMIEFLTPPLQRELGHVS